MGQSSSGFGCHSRRSQRQLVPRASTRFSPRVALANPRASLTNSDGDVVVDGRACITRKSITGASTLRAETCAARPRTCSALLSSALITSAKLTTTAGANDAGASRISYQTSTVPAVSLLRSSVQLGMLPAAGSPLRRRTFGVMLRMATSSALTLSVVLTLLCRACFAWLSSTKNATLSTARDILPTKTLREVAL